MPEVHMMTEEEIEACRKHWEADKPWEMRKAFMLAHRETLERDRLLCMGQLYVNIELLKNEYDQALMNEVRAMATKITKK